MISITVYEPLRDTGKKKAAPILKWFSKNWIGPCKKGRYEILEVSPSTERAAWLPNGVIDAMIFFQLVALVFNSEKHSFPIEEHLHA